MEDHKVFKGFKVDEWLYFKFSQKCKQSKIKKGQMIEQLIENFVFPQAERKEIKTNDNC